MAEEQTALERRAVGVLGVIWKFAAPIVATRFEIAMPRGAVLLALQLQRGEPQLWAVVVPERAQEKRVFEWFGTGTERLPHPAAYVGTLQLHEGNLVLHLFEVE